MPHAHTHHHHGHVSHSPPGHGKALAAGIGLNALFIAIEVFFGLQAGSLALLADAGHNAGDVLGLVLALLAVSLARRPASPRFTYGLQSASILAALGNALLLLGAVGFIVYSAILRLMSPEPAAGGTVIIVALAGVVINAATAWMLHAGSKHDLNTKAAFAHMAADALVSLGVAVSAVGMIATGWLWIDPVVGILVGLTIIASTWALLRDSLALALHGAPPGIETKLVHDFLSSQAGVAAVHDLHIWAMSTRTTALSAHLDMPGGHPGDHFLEKAANALHEQFGIGHVTLQIETQGHCHAGCSHE